MRERECMMDEGGSVVIEGEGGNVEGDMYGG